MALDWIAVEREAHQLGLDHGPLGHAYAAGRAAQAHGKHLVEEEEFWSAVAASLRPRGAATCPES